MTIGKISRATTPQTKEVNGKEIHTHRHNRKPQHWHNKNNNTKVITKLKCSCEPATTAALLQHQFVMFHKVFVLFFEAHSLGFAFCFSLLRFTLCDFSRQQFTFYNVVAWFLLLLLLLFQYIHIFSHRPLHYYSLQQRQPTPRSLPPLLLLLQLSLLAALVQQSATRF